MSKKNRNSTLIKRITKAMGETMKCCANTGVITRANAERCMGLSKNNIDKMIKNGYIKAETIVAKGTMVNVYRLDNKGVGWIRNNTDIEYMYRSNPRQIKHDLKLSQLYNQLSERVRNTWVNEHQLMKQWKQYSSTIQGEKAGTVDAIVISSGDKIAIEIITNNYGREELQEKYDAAQQLGCEKIIKIKA